MTNFSKLLLAVGLLFLLIQLITFILVKTQGVWAGF